MTNNDPNRKAFCFRIPGNPVAKGRPKAGRFTTKTGQSVAVFRTPKKTENYTALVQQMFASQIGDHMPWEGPIRIEITAVFQMPKTREKQRATLTKRFEKMTEDKPSGWILKNEAALSIAGEIGLLKYPTGRPDWDNLGKIISDALNGIAWRDDSQIVDASVKKFYTDPDEAPRVTVYAEKVKA